MATVTFLHAHPDDEAIVTAGTMAHLARDGHRVVLVVATRGELGEQPEGLLGAGETLAQRRTAEQDEAGRILGVDRIVWLDYLDSGMADEDSNHRDGAFAAVPVDEAADALATVLRDEDSRVLVTYDEHGGYGHPDHVQAHRVGIAAAERAGIPVVYMATMNRDVALGQLEASDGAWPAPPEEREAMRAEMQTMGEPDARITTAVDVRDVLDLKRGAMRAHASQIPEDSFFLAVPDDVSAALWGTEWYVRVDLAGPRDGEGRLSSPPDLTAREDRLALDEPAPDAGAAPAAGIHR